MKIYHHVNHLWDDAKAASLDPVGRLVYRSNLLGSDQRITNTGGGNTSSKITEKDPLNGQPVEVLWVKGSGGDLRTSTRENFSSLYQQKLLDLQKLYAARPDKGLKAPAEDDMVGMFSHTTFNLNPRPSSIDTPLHSFLPGKHVDHMHPNAIIAIAASAHCEKLTQEIFGGEMAYVPWMRPGFELGLAMQAVVKKNPKVKSIMMGQHGFISWDNDEKACYTYTLDCIERASEYIEAKYAAKGGDATAFGGPKYTSLPPEKRRDNFAAILPALRGLVSSEKRFIGTVQDDEKILRFVNSKEAARLAELGTSCPDHFLRTKIKPLYVNWNPQNEDLATLREKLAAGIERYRKDYAAYYEKCKHTNTARIPAQMIETLAKFLRVQKQLVQEFGREPTTEMLAEKMNLPVERVQQIVKIAQQPVSPAMRDPNPTVVLIPGLGMIAWGKDKSESRVTAEFYNCAVEVMRGAEAIDKYIALPQQEAFDIEYWLLEEAKLKRMPPEKELARQIIVVIGAGSGIGKETAHRLVKEGAHIVCVDLNEAAAKETAAEIAAKYGAGIGVAGTGLSNCGTAIGLAANITERASIRHMLDDVAIAYGGFDSICVTAGVFVPSNTTGHIPDDKWALTFAINVTGAYLVGDEASKTWKKQGLRGNLVLTTSANAVVAKKGSVAYDTSKAAANHLVRELAIELAPLVRVNGVAPATVVQGSAMFPRDRVIGSLAKYNIPYTDKEPTESLVNKLAQFYADRTLTKSPITPADQAEAYFLLVSNRLSKTTGQVITVDGGLYEAFLR